MLDFAHQDLPSDHDELPATVLMAWFKRESGELDTSGEKTVRTEGLWVKCDSCRQIIWKKDLEDN